MPNTNEFAAVIKLFNLQKLLFENVLIDISEEDSEKAPNENTNHIKWIAGHAVSSRHFLIKVLGGDSEFKYDNIFGSKSKAEGITDFPTISEIMQGWDELHEKVIKTIEQADESILEQDAPFGGGTKRDMVVFFAHHEAYHIGQISILRRYFGYQPMKYN